MTRNRNTQLELYTPDGWINIPAIAALPTFINIIIGPRQVGKTYGTLKYFLDENISHLYLRRTKEELKAVVDDPTLNPYLALTDEGYNVGLQKVSNYTWAIGDLDEESEKVRVKNRRGLAAGMFSVYSIRGFSGRLYTEGVYDEFIPEIAVNKKNGEGDAVLNAYTTINGNRELFGQPPFRLWLLANANDLFSPVLEAFHVTGAVESLVRTGKEWTIKDGVFVCLPRSEKAVGKRKKTALMGYLEKNGGGAFYDMAMRNQFSYSDIRLVKPKPIRGYKPYMRLGAYFIWERGNGDSLYMCRIAHQHHDAYLDTDDDRKRLALNHPELRIYYLMPAITFSDASALAFFKRILNL